MVDSRGVDACKERHVVGLQLAQRPCGTAHECAVDALVRRGGALITTIFMIIIGVGVVAVCAPHMLLPVPVQVAHIALAGAGARLEQVRRGRRVEEVPGLRGDCGAVQRGLWERHEVGDDCLRVAAVGDGVEVGFVWAWGRRYC